MLGSGESNRRSYDAYAIVDHHKQAKNRQISSAQAFVSGHRGSVVWRHCRTSSQLRREDRESREFARTSARARDWQRKIRAEGFPRGHTGVWKVNKYKSAPLRWFSLKLCFSAFRLEGCRLLPKRKHEGYLFFGLAWQPELGILDSVTRCL